ncbi:acetyl-CoA C-acyltransferase [compost metagenome]
MFRNVVTPEEVLAAPMLWDGVLTRLMACPPTCGGAAAIVVSEEFARKRGLRTDVLIAGQALATDLPSTYDTRDMIRVVGFDMTRLAATTAYEQAGIGPRDIDVIELHDCFAQNELLTYEGLGLCAEGEAERLVLDGDNTYGGEWVVNPSGGLLSKGHPLGATGLAQCYELTRQLRGTADSTQVEGARIAVQHNLGLGGAGVVTVFKKN